MTGMTALSTLNAELAPLPFIAARASRDGDESGFLADICKRATQNLAMLPVPWFWIAPDARALATTQDGKIHPLDLRGPTAAAITLSDLAERIAIEAKLPTAILIPDFPGVAAPQVANGNVPPGVRNALVM